MLRIVAVSKDSDVIRILCELAGIKYDLYHNLTTVDAPETVYYARLIPNIIISKPEMSMWKLILKEQFPPTRTIRYCCSALKEREGAGRFVMTGVRWAESGKRRKNWGSLNINAKKKVNSLILNADNDENRRLFETCQTKGKRVLNPIVDWTDDEVWDFLRYYGCESNPLYKNGYTRVGCIGCPMAGKKNRERDFINYPLYKNAYIKVFQKLVNTHCVNKHKNVWPSGEAVFDWWMRENPRVEVMDGQMEIE